MSADVERRLAELTVRYGLPAEAAEKLGRLLEMVVAEPASITSVRDPAAGVDVHVADSLAALELAEVRAARDVADLGSGGGFPGLVLAIARPEARVALIESVGRKAAFLARAVETLGLGNVEVVGERVETWGAGLGGSDLVTVRALAPLSVLVEYAAPLLRVGGALVAWKGCPGAEEEGHGAAAAAALGMSHPRGQVVTPYADADHRTLYLSLKVTETPPGYPRRPGMARKRPIEAST